MMLFNSFFLYFEEEASIMLFSWGDIDN